MNPLDWMQDRLNELGEQKVVPQAPIKYKDVAKFGQDVLQAAPRALGAGVLTAYGIDEYQPDESMSNKLLFGSDPIKSIPKQQKEGKDFLSQFTDEGTARNIAAFGVPIMLATDAVPIMPGKSALIKRLGKGVGEETAEQIAKQKAKQLLLEAPKAFDGYSDITTKTLKKLEGATVVKKAHIQGLINQQDIRPIERELLNDVLSGYDTDKIYVKDFAEKVHSRLPKFDRRPTSGYSNYTLEDVDGFPTTDYRVNTVNTPYKWNNQSFHFRGDNEPGQFYHTRTEDYEIRDKYYEKVAERAREIKALTKVEPLPEGGWQVTIPGESPYTTMHEPDIDWRARVQAENQLRREGIESGRVLTELQSDMMQDNRWRKELPSPTDTKRWIAEMEERIRNADKNIERFSRINDERIPIYQQAGLEPGKSMWDQPTYKQFELENNDTYGYGTTQKWRELLQDKYGIDREELELLMESGSFDDLKGLAATRLASVRDFHSYTTAELEKANKELAAILDGSALTDADREKQKFLSSYKGDEWWKFGLRNEINQAAKEGKTELLVPKGDTAAKIEHYVEKGRGGRISDESYSVGERVYDNDTGDHYIVLEDMGDEVRAIPEDKVRNSFDWEEAFNEEVSSDVYEAVRYPSDYDYHWKKVFENIEPEQLGLDDETLERFQEAYRIGDWDEMFETLGKSPDDFEDELAEVIRDEKGIYSAEDYANYWADATGQTHIADGDTVYQLAEDADDYIESLSKGGGDEGWPDDIRDELSGGQQNVYDYYDKSMAGYLQKLKNPNIQVEPNYDFEGNTFTRVKIDPREAKQGVEAFQMLPPAIAGGLTVQQLLFGDNEEQRY